MNFSCLFVTYFTALDRIVDLFCHLISETSVVIHATQNSSTLPEAQGAEI